MSSPPTVKGISACWRCGERPARYRVKTRQTSRHWVCLGCLRELIREGPIVVAGVAIAGVIYEHDISLHDEARATELLGVL